jgi:hypothetical protein
VLSRFSMLPWESVNMSRMLSQSLAQEYPIIVPRRLHGGIRA